MQTEWKVHHLNLLSVFVLVASFSMKLLSLRFLDDWLSLNLYSIIAFSVNIIFTLYSYYAALILYFQLHVLSPYIFILYAYYLLVFPLEYMLHEDKDCLAHSMCSINICWRYKDYILFLPVIDCFTPHQCKN